MEMSRALRDPSAPSGLAYPHLPAEFQLVIIRNWNLVPVERLAAVLKTTPENITAAADALGLPPPAGSKVLQRWMSRGYLTVIRTNWEILPVEQILELLDWQEAKFIRVLYEEDFMWTKMGGFKPKCKEVIFRELTPGEEERTAGIRALLRPLTAAIGGEVEPFAFLDEEEKPHDPPAQLPASDKLKMIYPYSLPYGDILSDGAPDAFPDGMLAAYAEAGVNALWIPVLLNDLTPWSGDDDIFTGWQERQKNLNRIVGKLRKFGLSLFLYINEPRAMSPALIAERHPDWGGPLGPNGLMQAICLRNPDVAAALRRGIADLFTAVPGLGGLLTISMSENLTHCASKPNVEVDCPRCGNSRDAAPHITALHRAITDGLRDAGSKARVIAWNWAWECADDQDMILAGIPDGVSVMSVSEKENDFETFGIKGNTFDYSIAYPGPSRCATGFWQKARQHGKPVIAKVQVNATWELSSLPAIPVPQLVRKHAESLQKCGVDEFLFSWTLGGFYGGNLPLFSMDLPAYFASRFGKVLTPAAEAATAAFSAAFSVFPQHGSGVVYHGPQNFGCANIIYDKPTGRKATMVGNPYDDLTKWCSRDHYTPEQLEEIFHYMADNWSKGLEILAAADTSAASPEERRNFEDLQRIADAAYCILKSSANQISFYRQRNSGNITDRAAILISEENLAKRFLLDMRRDSRIGFEASNHYMYTINSMWEKVLNCRLLQEQQR